VPPKPIVIINYPVYNRPMEPYRKSLRRKLPVFDPLPREWTEWKPAPAPVSEEELQLLGNLSLDGAIVLEFPNITPPEDIVA
jgi:hypothetical protein